MNLKFKNSQKKDINKLCKNNDINTKKNFKEIPSKIIKIKNSKRISKNIDTKKSIFKNIKNINKKRTRYKFDNNNKITLKVKQKGLGIFGNFVYDTSILYIKFVIRPFVERFFRDSKKIFEFFEDEEKGGKLIRLGLCDEAIVNVYIPFGINCLQIYFLIMGIILLQIASLLTATVFLSPAGIVVGFFSGLSNTFSGFLIATKNIYLSTSLNQNLDQINNIIKELINIDSNPKIKEVMNKFFKLDEHNGLIVIGKELEEIMSSKGITYIIKKKDSEDQKIDDPIRLESQLCNLITNIESILNTLEWEDIIVLYNKGQSLLEHICFAIGNFISLQLQYDNGSFGYGLKILVCDSYPDKTDALIKHLFKLLPNFILNLLINQVPLIKSLEKKSNNILDFFKESPENIFLLLEKNFPKVNWEPLIGPLRIIPILTYNNIIFEYLKDFNKVFFKNIKTVGLFIPLILIFSTIRYQYILKAEQKKQEKILIDSSISDDIPTEEKKVLIEEKLKDFKSQIFFNEIKKIIEPGIKSKIHNIIMN